MLTLSATALTGRAQTTTGGVRVGTAGAPDASAVLDLSPDATTAPKGLLPPRVTLTQRNNIGSPATGLVVYQTDNVPGLYVYNGSIWVLQGDNLGNHTATRNLNLGANQLVGNGGSQGLSITSSGGLLGSSTITASSDLIADNNQGNTGTLSGGLRLGGSGSGEGLASKRNAGGNQFGLDFYTASLNRLSISVAGNVGIGTTTPRGKLDVADGDTYLVADPNSGTSQTAYLPGHLFLAPYGGTSGRAYVQGRVPNPTSSTDIGLTLRTTTGGNLLDAVDITPTGDLNVSGNVGLNYYQNFGDVTLPGNSRGSFTISCPTGYRLLSGGGGHRDYNSAQNDITVNYSGPDNSNPTGTWTVLANNSSGSSRTIRIWCTCAKVQ